MSYEKYRGADAVILMDTQGNVRRLDPRLVDDDVLKTAKKAGFAPHEVKPDGFRKPRKRNAKQMRDLIEQGIVATEPQAPQTYGPETFVVDVPLATMSGETKPLAKG